MSKHHNYNNYSKPTNNNVSNEKNVEVKATTPTDDVETTVNAAVSTKDEDAVSIHGIIATGKVIDCERLRIRDGASLDSGIICVINKDDEIEIDTNKSTDDFYKVTTADGIEGFCMKKFVEIYTK